MSNGNIRMTKEDFGFNESEFELFFKMNTDIQKGSIQLQKRGDSYYWYFRESKHGNRNLKYLCKSYVGIENGLNSFQHCLKVLRERTHNNFVRKLTSNTQLSNLITEYRKYLLQEREDIDGRKNETLSSLTTSITQYEKFLLKEDLRFDDVRDSKFFKLHIKNYIDDMKKRELSRHTQRTYIKGIKRFLDWLVDDLDGKGILESHHLTNETLRQIHPITQRDREKSRRTRYSTQGYMDMYETCMFKVRDIWRDYIKNGLTREHRNQVMGVGTDVVYFVSLLQLGRGFRLGEILNSYRDEDSWLNRYDKKNSSSYWYKFEGDYFLYIDWKGKTSRVQVDGEYCKVRSFGEEENFWGVKESGRLKDGTKYYDTHIVDVCKELFRDSDYLFTSPNYRTHKNKHYSKTYYMNLFKQKMCNKGSGSEGFEKYDVISTHDLRDYFISEMIHTEKLTPEELSQVTRHSIQTMMKYYKRDSERTQKKITDKIDIKIRSRKVLNKDLGE